MVKIIVAGAFSMINRFQEIYEKNEWGHGSGEGSALCQSS